MPPHKARLAVLVSAWDKRRSCWLQGVIKSQQLRACIFHLHKFWYMQFTRLLGDAFLDHSTLYSGCNKELTAVSPSVTPSQLLVRESGPMNPSRIKGRSYRISAVKASHNSMTSNRCHYSRVVSVESLIAFNWSFWVALWDISLAICRVTSGIYCARQTPRTAVSVRAYVNQGGWKVHNPSAV